MKIGIFGDSFADVNYPLNRNPTPNWIELLQKKYKHIDVVSYGEAGSSLYYSVEQLKQFGHLYTTNVLLVTEPARVWAKDLDIDPPFKFLAGIDSIKAQIELLKQSINYSYVQKKHQRIVLEAVIAYKMYVQNYEEEVYKHNLMVNELLKKPNLILIPCFENCILGNAKGLYEIYRKENIAWQYNPDIDSGIDTRNCHMTAENNEIFAQKIIECIENGTTFNLNIDDYVTPMNKEFYINE